MLIIAGTITIDPARREQAIAAASELTGATRREPGCLAYTFSSDLQDASVMHLFERWESQAALDAHFQTEHMRRFQAVVPTLGVREMSLRKYTVSGEGPVF
jgi:quinol monooxygenase YgiN